MTKRTTSLLCAGLLGLVLVAHGSAIHIKAAVAQGLLEFSWQQHLADGEVHPPWPWADHWPIARLRVPDLNIDLLVLEGDSGNVLAFAPGHSPHSGLGIDDRSILISGHRDTHFNFLDSLVAGTEITIQTKEATGRWQVLGSRVVDSRNTTVPIHGDGILTLSTCWPLDALVPGGPERLLVRATPLATSRTSS